MYIYMVVMQKLKFPTITFVQVKTELERPGSQGVGHSPPSFWDSWNKKFEIWQ